MAKKYIGIWQALNIIERLQKKEKKQYGITSVFYALNSVKAYIKNLPAADVQEVKHGKWNVISYDDQDEGMYICSECRSVEFMPEEEDIYTYCPNCGAKMDGKDDEK